MIPVDRAAKALIFDCDGTLVDSMPTHMDAWRQAFARFGTKFEEEFVSSRRGMKETEIVKEYNQSFGKSLDPDEIVKIKHELFLIHLDKLKPIQPVVDIARANHGKLPLAVVSGGASKVVCSELSAIGILELFDVILTAADPYKPKPDPEIFLAASRLLNVSPECCLVFEDGTAGLEGARNAGMKTVDVREYLRV